MIEKGMPRTAMRGWKNELTEEQRRDVLAYIRSLVRFYNPVTPQTPPRRQYSRSRGAFSALSRLPSRMIQ